MSNDKKLESQLRMYLRNMELIKFRFQAIKNVRKGTLSTSYGFTDIEFCALQLRKIVELVGLSLLVSDLEEYKKHYNNCGKAWKLERILDDIEKINSQYWPVPTRIKRKEGQIDRMITAEDRVMDKAEILNIYGRCSEILHSANPLKPYKKWICPDARIDTYKISINHIDICA